MSIRVRAIALVAGYLGIPLRRALGAGIRHRGVTGGDHVVTCGRGRFYQVDLVTRDVALCVGLLPRIAPF